ncbi:MAG: hypothetical protein FWD73_01450 [Polyangiaceae bacterium]|nr:hypothetical protein [Polyangiaceae bacterium]
MHSSFRIRTLLSRSSLATILVASGVIAACSSSPSASNDEKTATTSAAITITGLFPTGVNDLGVPLANGAVDPHYTLSSPDPTCAGPNAVVVNLSTVSVAWVANTASSKWISCRTNGTGLDNTNYTYTTSFTLPVGVPPSTVTLSGRWACDDYCSIVVNGQNTGVVSQNPNFRASNPTAPSNFVVPAGTAFFQAGINTIQFVVSNLPGDQGLQIVSINATAGCAVDSDCGTGTFCNTQSQVCVAQLDNGVPIPIIPGHDPELDGTCTPEAGEVVCTSGVCDTADDLCGYDIGHACTANPECRSNECDANTNVCVPACALDSDCEAGNFCNTDLQQCTPQLGNGAAIPTIPGHDPPLDGTCTPEAGEVVCTSGVCDTADDLCGYDVGHACTADPECRSHECDPNTHVCVGCAVDSDCEAGNFCDTSLFMCTPQLSNGKPIPTIPGHTPPLDGTCTPEAGAVVCISSVCDTSDDLCGFAFGHPCTASPECRSNNCNMDTGLCDLPCCGNTYGGGDCVICEDAGPGNDAGADASGDASDASSDAATVNTPTEGTPQEPGNAGNGSPAQPSGNGNSSSGGGCQMGGGAANADLATLAGMLAMTVGALRRRRTARS